MIAKVLRLYHTIKYLKFKQIIWRFIYLFPRFITVDNKNPEIQIFNFKGIPKVGISENYDSFKFLNIELKLSNVGWNNQSLPKLWVYNLHYFDFLRQEEDSFELQKNIISNWISENPFGKGTSWEPYPTSLRIINWVKWHWRTSGLNRESQLSLWNQVRWLADRPEYHLLGNHLFVNAKALLFSCVLFGLDEKSIIYKKAIKILRKELNEQFLTDGAHFELSPMYHALAVEDLLDLYQLTSGLPSSFPSKELLERYISGMKWLSLMNYDCNELSHFNDCANGIAPTFKELCNLSEKIGIKLNLESESEFNLLKNSGFAVFKNKRIHLIADIGEIGPNYLPGHAHADTLSFELAINGHRVIVNSGTSEYGISGERLRQRGTSAHSTIEVDGESSSEVWSGFRVARRALVYNFEKKESSNSIEFSALHDGYTRLLKSPKHQRRWKLSDSGLEISDNVSGLQNSVQLRFYLHPNIHVEMIDDEIILRLSSEKIARIETNQIVQIVPSTYHDKFGSCQKNKCLLIRGTTPFSSKVSINWNF